MYRLWEFTRNPGYSLNDSRELVMDRHICESWAGLERLTRKYHGLVGQKVTKQRSSMACTWHLLSSYQLFIKYLTNREW